MKHNFSITSLPSFKYACVLSVPVDHNFLIQDIIKFCLSHFCYQLKYLYSIDYIFVRSFMSRKGVISFELLFNSEFNLRLLRNMWLVSLNEINLVNLFETNKKIKFPLCTTLKLISDFNLYSQYIIYLK